MRLSGKNLVTMAASLLLRRSIFLLADENLLQLIDPRRDCVAEDGSDVCVMNNNKRGIEPSITPDPNMHPMALPDGTVFYAYKTPPVSTFYKDGVFPIDTKARIPNLRGISGRFTNMSPKRKTLVWIPEHNPSNPAVITGVNAFETGGTATFYGHMFCFTDPSNIQECESEIFTVQPNVARYVYNPYEQEDNPYGSINDLNPSQRELYDVLIKDMAFSKVYKEFTGRDYLSRYPRRTPSHYMYPADYIGQIHTVETKETYYVNLPTDEEMKLSIGLGKLPVGQSRMLTEYRQPDQETLNLTLRVLSCAPRVYMIDDFLSDVEVDHFLQLATGMKLSRSTTSGNFADEKVEKNGVADTRTSENSWVYRHASPIIDSIYRRAADLLHIDEALMRPRTAEEFPGMPSKHSIAEALQLVRYTEGQEYTAHHDFGYARTSDALQPARFATLLLYLNEGMVGGETSFPRWVNAQTSDQLKVTPKKGQAVLFYSFLPDGNLDDLSQHAALPVRKGEKWLTNLWVWDPIYES